MGVAEDASGIPAYVAPCPNKPPGKKHVSTNMHWGGGDDLLPIFITHDYMSNIHPHTPTGEQHTHTRRQETGVAWFQGCELAWIKTPPRNEPQWTVPPAVFFL